MADLIKSLVRFFEMPSFEFWFSPTFWAYVFWALW